MGDAWLDNAGRTERMIVSCWLTKYEREALISLAWDCGGRGNGAVAPIVEKAVAQEF